MKRQRLFRATRLLAGLSLLVLVEGCASTPAAVPVQGAPAEIAALAGHWEGEYSSEATGRLGSIVLDLIAGEDHAHGDVLMIPRGSTDPYRPARRPNGGGPGPAEATQLLTIRFIRAEAGKLSGTLDPYWDPDCNCEVTTRFVGQVRGDTVEGTFTSERTAGRVFGTWKATRK
ncbi:MAG TPA: hypothetical protein VFW15_12525 [Thermoanaerobaculia bacterium]|nr:hypothetical protein [Thermoanaerobaculia bacterium]